jgi:hypothetical protein
VLESWECDQRCLGLLHPLFDLQRLSYPVFANESRIGNRVNFVSTSFARIRKDGRLDRPQRANKCFRREAGCLLRDFVGYIRITST